MLRFEIKRASPFKDLFTIRDEVVKRICDNMRQFGFDSSKPLVIWKGRGGILIDGYTRLVAAELANIREIPVIEKEFENENEALSYAIDCQRNRRNLDDAEIIKCADLLKRKWEKGGDHGNQYTGGEEAIATGAAIGRSSEEAAEVLGIGRGKVEKARTILEKAPEEIKDAVKSGEMSINAAYEKTMFLKREKSEPSKRKEDGDRKIKKLVRNIEKRLSQEEILKLIRFLREKFHQ